MVHLSGAPLGPLSENASKFFVSRKATAALNTFMGEICRFWTTNEGAA